MLGVKLFIVNKVYNKYPRMKRKWDSNYKLWQELPTNAEYQRKFVKQEMDKVCIHSKFSFFVMSKYLNIENVIKVVCTQSQNIDCYVENFGR